MAKIEIDMKLSGSLTKVFAVLTFGVTLIYAPFFFLELVDSELRFISLIAIVACLLLSQWRFRIEPGKLFLSFTFILITIYGANEYEEILSLIHYAIIFIFAIVFSNLLSKSLKYFSIYIFIYEFFVYLAVTLTVASLFYVTVIGQFDIFGFESDIYRHIVTPFGVHIVKYVEGFPLYRSYFYFVEPVFAGIFYGYNLLLRSNYNLRYPKLFLFMTMLGGMLTFSVAFYLILAFIFVIENVNRKNWLVFGASFSILISYIIFNELYHFSSIDDRYYRFQIFIEAVSEPGLYETFFGHGIVSKYYFERSFSSGALISIFEIGVIGFVFQLLLLAMIIPNFRAFFVSVLISLIIDFTKMPFMLAAMVLVSCAMNRRALRSNTK